MRRQLYLLSAALLTSMCANAQTLWHKKPTQEEIAIRQTYKRPTPTSANKTTATFTMPAGARMPGEFEESQAVAIAWPYDWNGSAMVLDVTSEYADVWADMADAIQKECTVWIRIEAAADSTPIKTFMSGKSKPLANYKFWITAGDAFWMRDYGPLGFYYGANDDLGFLDINYYPGRDLDDVFPEYLATQKGYLHVRTNLYAEGGNFLTDGFGNTFHSDVIESVNMTAQPKHGAWTLQQVKDTVKYVFASPNVTVNKSLECDGGTGHNDMYMKLVDENTYAIMEYPATVTAQDKAIIDSAIAKVSRMKNVYGRPYRIFKMPMPTRDNGTLPSTCGQINNDARTYVNGTWVNKTYLMPIYSDGSSGNQAGDQAAINLFKQVAPGYKIVPLDARGLTIGGGAIHCVTMQIPAENPITIWHPPVIDWQAKASSYPIVAKITNKSGIATAQCKWRKKGTTTWNTVNLTDSSGYKIGDMVGTFNHGEAYEYYITATSNNGKTITKPMTAPDGFYTYMINWPAGINSLNPNTNFLLNPLPNPNNGSFTLPMAIDKDMQITAVVTDVTGRTVRKIDFGKKENGMHQLQFNLYNVAEGSYFIQVFGDSYSLGNKRVVKQ